MEWPLQLIRSGTPRSATQCFDNSLRKWAQLGASGSRAAGERKRSCWNDRKRSALKVARRLEGQRWASGLIGVAVCTLRTVDLCTSPSSRSSSLAYTMNSEHGTV